MCVKGRTKPDERLMLEKVSLQQLNHSSGNIIILVIFEMKIEKDIKVPTVYFCPLFR